MLDISTLAHQETCWGPLLGDPFGGYETMQLSFQVWEIILLDAFWNFTHYVF